MLRPRVTSLPVLLGALCSPLYASQAHGQGAVERVISGGVTCTACSIRAAVRVNLTSAVVEGEINDLPFAVREDARGRFWVLGPEGPPRIYRATGQYLRTFGIQGRGPGEFILTEDLFWTPGDSLVVVDAGNQRATVFGPEERYVRQVRTPVQMVNAVVVHWPAHVLVSAHIASPSSAGFPLHIASLAGHEARMAKSFGPDNGLLRPGSRASTYQLLARGGNGPLYTVSPDQYRLHSWNTDGFLLSTIQRRVSWFPDSGAARLGTPDRPPTAGINAIAVDQDGLVWVFARVPSANWKRGWSRLPPGAREVRRSQLDFAALYDTRVEVLDPTRAQVVASLDLPGVTLSVLRAGSIAQYARTDEGDGVIRVLDLALVRTR